MDRKKEDQWIEFAFGDLRGDAADALRDEIANDPAAQRLVHQMQQMKEGLTRLPVPPCQVSTERLRDAILNQGLHPRSNAPSWWRMAWMPVAAAVLAVVSMQFLAPTQPAPERGPVAIVESGTGSRNAETSIDGGASRVAEAYGDALDRQLAARSERVAPSSGSTSRPRFRGGATSRSAESRVDGLMARNAVSAGAGAATLAPAPPAIAPSAGVASLAADEPPGGIILIGSERDTTTGASRAIEVKDASNVLIGG